LHDHEEPKEQKMSFEGKYFDMELYQSDESHIDVYSGKTEVLSMWQLVTCKWSLAYPSFLCSPAQRLCLPAVKSYKTSQRYEAIE
jgi:hypothetical protein